MRCAIICPIRSSACCNLGEHIQEKQKKHRCDPKYTISQWTSLLRLKIKGTCFNKQAGKKIEVKVQMPELITKSGSCLDFACTGYPNKICIDSLSLKDCDSMKEEKRDIMVLEESSQKELVKYS